MSEEESGMLNETTWVDSTFNEYCDGWNESSLWEMASGASTDSTTNGEWDEIAQFDSKIVRFFMHFEDRPDSLMFEGCPASDDLLPEPHNFRFEIGPGEDENPSDFYFSNPHPIDGSDESDNDYLGLALDLVGDWGTVYTDLASTIIDYSLDSGGDSTSVSSPSAGEFTFDIDVSGGYDDFPSEDSNEATAVSVGAYINNDYSDGTRIFEYMPEYTFEIWDPTTMSGGSECGCTSPVTRYVTTVPSYTPDGRLDVV